MLFASLVATCAFAASSGGFSVDAGVPQPSIGVRSALALAPEGGQWVSQTTVAARAVPHPKLSVYGQVPWVITGSSGPDDHPLGSGIGQMRLGFLRAARPSGRVTAMAGAEAGIPVGYEWMELGWVEAPYTAQRGVDAFAVAQATVAEPDRLAFTARLASGWRWAPDLSKFGEGGRHQLHLEVAAALAAPTWGRSALLLEGKALTGATPYAAVAALRVDSPRQIAVDAGMHVMVGSPQKGKVALGPLFQIRQAL